jgi:O-antigen ligase
LLPGISEDGQSHSVRVHDGALFALVFVLGAAASFAVAYLARARPSAERQRLLLRIAAGLAVAAIVVGAVVGLSRGNPLGGGEVVSQNPGRLLSSSSNNRWSWWKEAWEGFKGEPVIGTGAGSFELLHRKLRDSPVDVREVHNLPLQFAAETGLVGFLLAAGAAGAALLGVARGLQRLSEPDYSAAAALAVSLPTFLFHGLLDYDWEFVALCGPLFFVTGFLLTTGREPRPPRRRPFWALAAVLVAWAALYSIVAPRVAASKVDAAYSDIEHGSLDKAVADAKSAHSLNPVSVEPLYAWAAAEEAKARVGKARDLYLRAVDLQPLNWETWYELGRFDIEVLGHDVAGRRELERARELDPYGPARRALALKRS